MANLREELRRRLAPLSLRFWPSLSNPVWQLDVAGAQFGDRLRIEIPPGQIARKIDSAAAAGLRGNFLVSGLDAVSSTPIGDLYTYRDMEDIVRYGEDWRETRLGQWLLASIAAGRAPNVRGEIMRDVGQIERYYRVYLDMYRSMQAIGYRYEGKDQMCFGIGREGRVILIRRGTHRLAAAQLLELPVVSGKVTHIDREFAFATQRRFPDLTASEALLRGVRSVGQQ